MSEIKQSGVDLDAFKKNHSEETIDASKKVRIGIIGTGGIAEAHLQKYLEMPDVELVGAVPGESTLQLTNLGTATATVAIRLGESTHDLLVEPGTTATQPIGEGDLVDVDVPSSQPMVGAVVTASAIVPLTPGSAVEAQPMQAELVPTLR